MPRELEGGPAVNILILETLCHLSSGKRARRVSCLIVGLNATANLNLISKPEIEEMDARLECVPILQR